MTDEDIITALAICEKATSPRPWATCGAQAGAACACRLIWSGDHETTVVSASAAGQNMREQGDVASPADLTLIVAAVNGYESALREVQRLRAETAAEREEVQDTYDMYRRNVVHAKGQIEQLRADLGALTKAVGDILADNGCDCACDHRRDEHDGDCERCLACRVDAALAPDQVAP